MLRYSILCIITVLYIVSLRYGMLGITELYVTLAITERYDRGVRRL
jgi:hypothetical protein